MTPRSGTLMRIGGPAGKTRSRSWWRASFNSAPGHPLLYTLALAPLLTRSVPCVAAGIADTPLPVLQAGATTQFLYSVPGVIQGGNISTFFLCTSTDTASQQVGVEVFPYPGGAPCNDAAAESFSLGPGAPTNATVAATPSTPPIWRTAWFTALPTPKRAGARRATAAPLSDGSTMPTAVPVIDRPGSQTPR